MDCCRAIQRLRHYLARHALSKQVPGLGEQQMKYFTRLTEYVFRIGCPNARSQDTRRKASPGHTCALFCAERYGLSVKVRFIAKRLS